ncbi:hypothetical protein EHV15_09370 [Paenibacillus oralis]|uniref:DUF975 family protein n=1 Tax=Paenibacillus oralis TaxID=2490856 RepID=A0A3P3TYB6_9BACL|nr:hypothetical protein [Paenibacillus oralis]RRJ63112.1 hypothetical protein EHV15_09370 [Paenibacillus oralis]
MTYVRQGWDLLKSQFPSVIILFLYQLLWGLFLYRLVDTAVTALLQRYPDPPPTQLSRFLFLLEGRIYLGSNPDVRLYLGLLIGMAVLRLLLTPLIQAGIFYGLVPSESRAHGLPLFRGMKEFWKPVAVFYALEFTLIILPSFWIVPKLLRLWPHLLGAGGQMAPMLTGLIYILGWFVYGWLVRQCILYVQFGYLFKSSVWGSLLVCFRHLLQGIGISLILGAFGLGVFLLFGTVSWIWTGMLALILQQTYPLFRSAFKVWQVTSQYRLWQTKTEKS